LRGTTEAFWTAQVASGGFRFGRIAGVLLCMESDTSSGILEKMSQENFEVAPAS
jgi:hypothetical protein